MTQRMRRKFNEVKLQQTVFKTLNKPYHLEQLQGSSKSHYHIYLFMKFYLKEEIKVFMLLWMIAYTLMIK